MAPTISPTTQVWRAAATSGREYRWHFRNSNSLQCCFHNHLAGELHPGGLQVEMKHCRFAEAAQAAMKVATGTAKKQATYRCQHRVTQVAMEWRHRAWFNSAEKAVAHYKIIAFPQFRHERSERTEVITVISITHDDVLATRGRNAAHQSVAVSPGLNINHARAMLLCNFLRAVGAAVVGNNNFTLDIVFRERFFRLLNTGCQCLSLIQTRHDNRELYRSFSHRFFRPSSGSFIFEQIFSSKHDPQKHTKPNTKLA